MTSPRRRSMAIGHEITRAADDLVPFGASLPKRAKPVTTYRED